MSVKDYKNTLNLPNTEFAMKANLVEREPKMLESWYKMGIYERMQAKRVNAKQFILLDGPPYANGKIHMGHALNKILKDIILKSKYLSGYSVPYIPGWDCHGLPIELNVEKKFGKANEKLSAKEFRQKCREYAKEQIEIQKAEFKRLGIFADWEHPYSTMDKKMEASILRTLARVIQKGHLQRGEKPVHWCLNCASALAEAEVEYKNKESLAIDVMFKVIDQVALLKVFGVNNPQDSDLFIVVWTTTPWTLPANEAIAVNQDFSYCLLKTARGLIILSKDLAAAFIERSELQAEIIGECLGADLEGYKAMHPFYDRVVPIILGDHVTLDAGTGCVHIAPAHGYDDYLLGLKYKLPVHNPVNGDGVFIEGTKLFAGMFVFKANDAVVEVLKNNNRLACLKQLTHSYPHCWRHKTPLIFRSTAQWFVSMEKANLRVDALGAINTVTWYPDWGMARIDSMVRNRPDWCISRQRVWCTPMPLFLHIKTRELHPRTVELIEAVALKVEQHGLEVWYELDNAELLGPEHQEYEKVMDTLDVWFDSGAVHAGMFNGTADLYLEGSDQHRGWFQTSLLLSVATQEVAPFKEVVTHGFTIDAEGQKMSKSLGNVVAPQDILKTLGADILRLWVASTDYHKDLHVSKEIFSRASDAYRRMRNTARFLLANLAGFVPSEHLVRGRDLLALDRWIVKHTLKLQQEILTAYHDYNFHLVYQKVHNFCVNELGGFYLDIIKDRQYTCKASSLARRSCQTALYFIAEYLVRWLAPVLSFTAEEIWQNLPARTEESVFLTAWFELDAAYRAELLQNDSFDDAFWQQIVNIRSEVNKALEDARKADLIGASLEAVVNISVGQEAFDKLTLLGDELRFIFITSKVVLVLNKENKLVIEVNKSTHHKCERCWHRVEDVNTHKDYEGICGRCVENLTTDNGEKRAFA